MPKLGLVHAERFRHANINCVQCAYGRTILPYLSYSTRLSAVPYSIWEKILLKLILMVRCHGGAIACNVLRGTSTNLLVTTFSGAGSLELVEGTRRFGAAVSLFTIVISRSRLSYG